MKYGMEEEWAQVNSHWVSNRGRIWNKRLKLAFVPQPDETGYPRLNRGGISIKVHRLVADAFLPAPPTIDHTTVDHIDRDRSNNCVDNLRWATPAEQSSNRNFSNSKNNAQSLEVELYNGTDWIWFPSVAELSRHLRVSTGTLNYNLYGKGTDFVVRIKDVEQVFPDETWMCIDGIDVSSYGRCKSAQGRPFFPNPQKNGYPYKNNKLVHRLVAAAFLPAPPTSLHVTVDHIDRNRSNNHYLNLRWATATDQAVNKKRRRQTSSQLKRAVIATCLRTNQETKYDSPSDASRLLSADVSNISRAARGDRNGCALGFRWRYV